LGCRESERETASFGRDLRDGARLSLSANWAVRIRSNVVRRSSYPASRLVGVPNRRFPGRRATNEYWEHATNKDFVHLKNAALDSLYLQRIIPAQGYPTIMTLCRHWICISHRPSGSTRASQAASTSGSPHRRGPSRRIEFSAKRRLTARRRLVVRSSTSESCSLRSCSARLRWRRPD